MTEWEKYKQMAIGTIIVGELNVHHQRWLRYSSRNSAEGEALRNLCDEAGLQQLVREPTRGKHLLDLALTDIDDVKCKVLTKVADHKGLGITLTLPVPLVATPVRRVWQYRDADWEGLRDALNSQDWSWLKHVDAHVGAERLTDNILDLSRQFIPERLLHERKTTHPWINDRVLELVRAKRVAEGTALEEVSREQCSKGILDKFHNYVQKERGALQNMWRGAKGWWS